MDFMKRAAEPYRIAFAPSLLLTHNSTRAAINPVSHRSPFRQYVFRSPRCQHSTSKDRPKGSVTLSHVCQWLHLLHAQTHCWVDRTQFGNEGNGGARCLFRPSCARLLSPPSSRGNSARLARTAKGSVYGSEISAPMLIVQGTDQRDDYTFFASRTLRPPRRWRRPDTLRDEPCHPSDDTQDKLKE